MVSPGSDVTCLLPTSLGPDEAKDRSVEIVVLLLGSQVPAPVRAPVRASERPAFSVKAACRREQLS